MSTWEVALSCSGFSTPNLVPRGPPALTCGISSSLSHTLKSAEAAVMETQVNG